MAQRQVTSGQRQAVRREGRGLGLQQGGAVNGGLPLVLSKALLDRMVDLSREARWSDLSGGFDRGARRCRRAAAGACHATTSFLRARPGAAKPVLSAVRNLLLPFCFSGRPAWRPAVSPRRARDRRPSTKKLDEWQTPPPLDPPPTTPLGSHGAARTPPSRLPIPRNNPSIGQTLSPKSARCSTLARGRATP